MKQKKRVKENQIHTGNGNAGNEISQSTNENSRDESPGPGVIVQPLQADDSR